MTVSYNGWTVGDSVTYHRLSRRKYRDELPDLPHMAEGRVVAPDKEDFPKDAARVYFPGKGEATIDSTCLERIL
jgi:hypothetical protein